MKIFQGLQVVQASVRLPHCGICSNLPDEVYFEFRAHAEQAYQTWPEYSGEAAFPVQHPDFAYPWEGYLENRGSMWSGEYGAARLRLLQHLINWFKERDL